MYIMKQKAPKIRTREKSANIMYASNMSVTL